MEIWELKLTIAEWLFKSAAIIMAFCAILFGLIVKSNTPDKAHKDKHGTN